MVVDHYSSLARDESTKNDEHIKKVAESFGYAPEDLAGIPEGANLGVSCGNPLAVAGLKPVCSLSSSSPFPFLCLLYFPQCFKGKERHSHVLDVNLPQGETVLDLGSGAGFDVFQAARKVGPTGLAIGIDLSESMLTRARSNAAKSGIENVKFVLGSISDIPLEDESVDCVISNCVINLLPTEQKETCFREIARVLKKGGRVAVSDILAKKPMPAELRGDLGLYVGCVSGASEVGEYEGWLRGAGFEGSRHSF